MSPLLRRLPLDLCAALAACVLLRALLLHTAFDQVGLWMYELYPMGTLAELTQRGVAFPLRFYYDNAAGQIFSGFAAVPSFALFGPTYLALKLVPFAMGIGLVAVAWFWLRAAFGRLAANVGAWSLVLAPATLFKYSVTCSGNHFENLLFSLLAVAAFGRVHRLGPTRVRLFVFGLASGFALFVFLGALLPLAILAAIHLGLRRLGGSLRDLGWVVAGLLTGLLPLFVLNLATGGRGLGFLGAKFAATDTAAGAPSLALDRLGPILGRMREYLFVELPRAATSPDAFGLDGSTWNRIVFVALLGTWLAALPLALRAVLRLVRGGPGASAAADWPFVLFVGYLPLSALAYGVSNFRLGGHGGATEYGGYRYYLPCFVFGALCSAALVGRAWRAGGRARWPALALAGLGLAPGLADLRLIDWSFTRTGLGTRYEGYDLSKVARGLLSARNAVSHEEQIAYLDRFPAAMSARVTRAIGFNLAVQQIELARAASPGAAGSWWLDLEALLAAWPERFQRELARGAGTGMRFAQVGGGADVAGLLAPLRLTWERASPRARAHFERLLEGLSTPTPTLPLVEHAERISTATNGLLGLALATDLAPELKLGLARGQGFLCGRLVRRGIADDLETVARRRAELPQSCQAAFHEGLGAGCAEGGEEPGGHGTFGLDEPQLARFWSGFAGELRALHGARAEAQCATLLARLAPESRNALARALAQH